MMTEGRFRNISKLNADANVIFNFNFKFKKNLKEHSAV